MLILSMNLLAKNTSTYSLFSKLNKKPAVNKIPTKPQVPTPTPNSDPLTDEDKQIEDEYEYRYIKYYDESSEESESVPEDQREVLEKTVKAAHAQEANSNKKAGTKAAAAAAPKGAVAKSYKKNNILDIQIIPTLEKQIKLLQ